METEKMIYLVTEYAAGGEIFGKFNCNVYLSGYIRGIWKIYFLL